MPVIVISGVSKHLRAYRVSGRNHRKHSAMTDADETSAGQRNLHPCWTLPDDVVYLNHGSFGPSPKVVQQARDRWSAELESQPMDFFLRQMEHQLDQAAGCLADFVGTKREHLVFIDNATAGMNVVAANIDLNSGDEVLVTDQEYGAVLRIWRRKCEKVGARVIVREVPLPPSSPDDLADHFMQAVNNKTRVIVISHVSSPTSLVFPVEEICRRARQQNVAVCIDGPHALAMRPINLKKIDCDYYTASCHKWLCAPFGSGFLYVAPRRQKKVIPVVVSWGGSLAGRDFHWKDEFNWIGTRDPAPFLTVPTAIDFMQEFGLQKFRETTHELARYARGCISELTQLEPLTPDSCDWYGSMVTLPLPSSDEKPLKPNQRDPLQIRLWEQHQIEIPVIHWQKRRFIRVSCHLYNTRDDIDHLVEALSKEL